jgi:hypothetical protein
MSLGTYVASYLYMGKKGNGLEHVIVLGIPMVGRVFRGGRRGITKVPASVGFPGLLEGVGNSRTAAVLDYHHNSYSAAERINLGIGGWSGVAKAWRKEFTMRNGPIWTRFLLHRPNLLSLENT